jgi:hypothetical protein
MFARARVRARGASADSRRGLRTALALGQDGGFEYVGQVQSRVDLANYCEIRVPNTDSRWLPRINGYAPRTMACTDGRCTQF